MPCYYYGRRSATSLHTSVSSKSWACEGTRSAPAPDISQWLVGQRLPVRPVQPTAIETQNRKAWNINVLSLS